MEEGGKLGGFIVRPKLEWKEMLVLLKDKVEASALIAVAGCSMDCSACTISLRYLESDTLSSRDSVCRFLMGKLPMPMLVLVIV